MGEIMDNNEMNKENQNNVQPVQPNNIVNVNANLEEPMSIGSWLVTMLILCIPCVSIVMVFVWAFGSESKTKGNYFKAVLIMALIMIIIEIVLLIVFWASFAGLAASMGNVNWNALY
jgi:hypothetical protein